MREVDVGGASRLTDAAGEAEATVRLAYGIGLNEEETVQNSQRHLVVFGLMAMAATNAAMRPSSGRCGDPAAKPAWTYSPEQLRPFWDGDTAYGESVLFIRNTESGEARASVLFPIREVVTVQSSAGDVTYESGKDFVWKANSRELVLPAGSRIPSRTPAELRRPAKTQKYALTHRDGKGEILFGGKLEYADMQTCITYRHEPGLWKASVPRFDPARLRRTVSRLANHQPTMIVTLGDSISAGSNASALYDSAPFQPAYPELVRRHLAERFGTQVEMKNLAVGGTDTGWGLMQVDKVIEAQPQLVILAFGMNDAAERPPQSYQENTKGMIDAIRAKLPDCEFILVASMLGNRDWVRLKPDAFPKYRDGLHVGSSRVDLQACKLEYSIVSPK